MSAFRPYSDTMLIARMAESRLHKPPLTTAHIIRLIDFGRF
jgi:hypothetical protein